MTKESQFIKDTLNTLNIFDKLTDEEVGWINEQIDYWKLKAKQEVFDDFEDLRKKNYSWVNSIAFQKVKEKHLHPIRTNSTPLESVH